MRTARFFLPAIILLLMATFAGCNKELPENHFEPYIWSTASPGEEGMDSQRLDSAFILASRSGLLDGLLVIRNGRIVAEAYYNGFAADRPHNIKSASKSMLSAITGMVLYGSYGLDLDDRMLDYFPQYASGQLDPRKQDITIEHLLTMRMGIEGEAYNNYSVYWELYNASNWIQSTIEYPLVNDPGATMKYNTFITHLLSGVITEATGQGTDKFAESNLFAPMGIDIDSWEKDPQGICFGGNSMFVTPREMAVLGLLYLQNGKLNDKQIIPEAWVKKSLTASTLFTHPNEWGGWRNYNYAYLWWLGEFSEHSSFMAYGYGGQFIIVFPGLNLIVVTTAPDEVQPETTTIQEWAIFDLVNDYILPSIY